MLCENPYMGGVVPVACGGCLPCRINHRRLWTWRQVLESYTHDESCFVTLTYDEASLPHGNTLVPKDFQRFMWNLRQLLGDTKIRFFGVGEYGDKTERPHYHLSIFGAGEWISPLVKRAWVKEGLPLGFSMVAEFNSNTAQYVCGYTTKKMTNSVHPKLKGRWPEFSRKSLRPGLGAPAIPIIADAIRPHLKPDQDVPISLRMGKRHVPLGRYLRQKLRDHLEIPKDVQERCKQEVIDQAWDELHALWKNPRHPEENRPLTYKELMQRENKGRNASVVAKYKLRKDPKL